MLRFYKNLDKILTNYGNKAYDYLKQIEPLCMANYLYRFENIPISKNYIHKLLEDGRKEPGMEYHMKLIYEEIERVGTHPLELFEVIGCFRHFGHPTVDELAGVDSLRTNSQEEIEMDPEQLAKVSGAFNRMIILEFINQKNRWPKCKLKEECENRNMEFLILNTPQAISEYDLALSLKDWSMIDFEQEFNFDDFPDFTALLSDSAISPYLSHWYTVFNREILKVEMPTDMEESRRVLLEVLKRDVIECQEIRKKIQLKLNILNLTIKLNILTYYFYQLKQITIFEYLMYNKQ